jgi:hypothetical protein
MRFSVGGRVSVPATYFDEPNRRKWSEHHFPQTWQTQIMEGTIVRQGTGSNEWMVCFDFDNDVQSILESKLTLLSAFTTAAEDRYTGKSAWNYLHFVRV